MSTKLISKGWALSVVVMGSLAAGAHAQEGKTPKMVLSKMGEIEVRHLATLEEPWGMAVMPDDRLLITEKPGRLRIYANGKLSSPITGLPKIEYQGQGGLMDVVLDPDFAKNKLVYLYFVEAAAQQPANVDDSWDDRLGDPPKEPDKVLKGGAVARGRLDGEHLRDLTVIWRQTPKTIGRGHFGGRLAFAPDGKLFITSGDRQRFDPAQDPGSTLGKVVRINSDGTIPQDNPFANESGPKREVWSMGHRNPLGAAINPVTKALWINEMGPRHGDELNIIAAGKNYGWPIVSNGDNYNGVPIPDHPTRPEFAPPAFYWFPAISPSGLMFYSGDMFSDWKGSALIGSLSTEVLVRLKLDGDKVVQEERIDLRRRIRAIVQASDGAILLLTDYKDGELLRLSPKK